MCCYVFWARLVGCGAVGTCNVPLRIVARYCQAAGLAVAPAIGAYLFDATPGEGVAYRTDDEFKFRMIAHPRGSVLLGRVAHIPSALFTPIALAPTHWNCTLTGRRPGPFVQDVISVPPNQGLMVATGADIYFRINQLPMSLAPACSIDVDTEGRGDTRLRHAS